MPETGPQPAIKPKVAIIIDDVGFTKKIARQIIDLDLNLTFSILPFGPHSKFLSERAHKLGRDILLHLPMEASDNKWDPGPGALMLIMPKAHLIKTLQQDIAEIPMAIGINNHMGSKFTENPAGMRVVLQVMKDKNLFFVDSLTSPKSLGYRLARDLNIKTVKRDVFLDNVKDVKTIISRLQTVIDIAKKGGNAVAIAHPHQETLDALVNFQQTLRQDVSLVGIHELVK